VAQVTFTAAQLATLFTADDSLFTVNPTTGAITFAQEPMPSGDDHTGLGFFLNPTTNTFQLQPVRQTFGPMAMTPGAIGNTPITAIWNPADPQAPWTQLVTAVPGAPFMRGGMAGYLPNGRWGLMGALGVAASPAAFNATVYLRVMQGTNEGNPGQPNIATGNPITIDPATGLHVDNRVMVGGGYATIDYSNRAGEVIFFATDIQCNVPFGHACEIILEACATSLGVTALAATGPEIIGSRGTFTRWNGMPAVYNNA
jgi:hypothetical protein